MRTALKILLLPSVLLGAAIVPRGALGQQSSDNPYTRETLPGKNSRDLVVQFLDLRFSITHEQPVLSVCDSVMRALMNPALESELKRRKLVARVDFSCQNDWGKGNPVRYAPARLNLERVQMGKDSATVVAGYSEFECIGRVEEATFVRFDAWRVVSIRIGAPRGASDCIGYTTRKDGRPPG